MSSQKKIAVVGLGYVGLPLAVSLANRRHVVGFDVDQQRIQELQKGEDRTKEISSDKLKASSLVLTHRLEDLREASVYIVAVPTPVDLDNKPDFAALIAASETVGQVLSKGDTVVFESTVYPGVTEDLCGVTLEKISGLVCGKDFYLGYSPERINPGDKVHTVESITKVVAAQTPEIAEELKDLYGAINGGNIFIAASIKVAEAAKVIENAQRDINIAFMNEISQIFSKLEISTFDVLDAARTKWNFLPFSPGLVGGHCIGVDPFYLAECSRQVGLHPQIILSGRDLNDDMGRRLGATINEKVSSCFKAKGKLLVLGLTFKENVPDLRNTKVIDLINSLQKRGYEVDVLDPEADPSEAQRFYEVALKTPDQCVSGDYQGVILAVPHDAFKKYNVSFLSSLLKDQGLVLDIKGFWRETVIAKSLPYWTL